MRTHRLRTAATGTAAATALLLSPAAALADNGKDPSAKELSDQARETLAEAKSVHLKLLDKSANARASESSPTSLDLSFDRDGNCAGSIRMGGDGGSVKVVIRDDQAWVKPDTAFWKAQLPDGQGDTAAKTVKNRYVHGSTNDALLAGMADACDLKTFQSEVAESGERHALKKGAETTVEGAEVIPVTFVDEGTTTTLYISTDSDHHLVLATKKGDDTDLALTFADYNEPVPSATPPAAESVDISELPEELRNP
ncbi:hypothetical protein C4B68_15505 [Streptomyces dengpaensis]|uniref:Lipoprotein n=1 Tax=Streptomyces dengpaensis TaxID=2049881 RepID=A0ABN5IDJ3_9ACTN|nr:hypothetical protein C4B68_15505 [Streptomyces dengpaensis]